MKQIFISILILSSICLDAQVRFSRDYEYQAWSEISVAYEVIDNLEFSVSPAIRMNAFAVGKKLYEVGSKYKFNKYLSMGADFRYSEEPKKKRTDISYRFSANIKVSVKSYRFKPTLKVRYTSKDKLDNSKKSNFLRYKATLAYRENKSVFSPYFFAEFFEDQRKREFTKFRSGIGNDVEITKFVSFDIAYILEYSLTKDKNEHILSMGFSFKIN